MTITTLNKVKTEVEKRLHTSRRSHDLDHILRVYNMCLHIGKVEGANLQILQLAALLHDVARTEEDESGGQLCHAAQGAVIANLILKELDVEQQIINAVVHCVATHRFRDDTCPQTLEAKVLFDADKLDGIGAIGIGRAFVFAGENGARVHNKNVDLSKTESYSVEDTAWREYNVKLRYVKDRMLTDEGKRIAKGRHMFMEQFFKRLNLEVDGEL